MSLPGLEELLKAHEELLERGRKMAAAAARHPEKLPELLHGQRIAERDRLNRRIDRLVAERDRVTARFAAEIDQERKALARIEAEMAAARPKEESKSSSKKKRG